MVRAWGFVLLGLGWVTFLGCGNEGGVSSQPQALSKQAAEELRYDRPAATAAAPAATNLLQPGKELDHGSGDKFAHLPENDFQAVQDSPLSTFSIDVDTASYAKTRMFLMERQTLPPADAVRIEELINYFDYDYAGPTDDRPFAVHLETAECPWEPKHRLVRCALQGRKLHGDRPPSNLVFLIDVSGSMATANKLPLVQRSLTQLVRQLGENDRVSIVVYAGAAGMILPPTNGTQQAAILTAINNLHAGGSTNGGQGIQLAYQLATENFLKSGTNPGQSSVKRR